jgi:hypothetical protein
MFSDGAVPSLKLHLTDLPFTKVLKDAVRSVTIRIAVLKVPLPL